MILPFPTLLAAFLVFQAPNSASDETRDLFGKAATQYETSDYRGAVETYTAAYTLSSSIDDGELRGRVQAAILFNLARAHSKAYVLDKNAEHVRQQEDLLEKYLAQTADLADQFDAEQLLEQARAELAFLEDEERTAEARAQEQAAPGPVESEGQPRKKGLQTAGYTLLALGVASGGVAIAGGVLAAQADDAYTAGPTLADRNSAESNGSTANLMIIVGSASAGALVTTGVALIIMGRKRQPAVSPSAWATPTSGGIVLRGRF